MKQSLMPPVIPGAGPTFGVRAVRPDPEELPCRMESPWDAERRRDDRMIRSITAGVLLSYLAGYAQGGTAALLALVGGGLAYHRLEKFLGRNRNREG
jgi:hypothetical protein